MPPRKSAVRKTTRAAPPKSPKGKEPEELPVVSPMSRGYGGYKRKEGPAAAYPGKMRNMKSGEQTGLTREDYDVMLQDLVKTTQKHDIGFLPATQFTNPSEMADKTQIKELARKAKKSEAMILYSQASVSKRSAAESHANVVKINKIKRKITMMEPNDRIVYPEHAEFARRLAKDMGDYKHKTRVCGVNVGGSCQGSGVYAAGTDMFGNPHSDKTPPRIQEIRGMSKTAKTTVMSPILGGVAQKTYGMKQPTRKPTRSQTQGKK